MGNYREIVKSLFFYILFGIVEKYCYICYVTY